MIPVIANVASASLSLEAGGALSASSRRIRTNVGRTQHSGRAHMLFEKITDDTKQVDGRARTYLFLYPGKYIWLALAHFYSVIEINLS